MYVPFIDLKAQYQSIKSEMDEAIQKVVENTAFIQGQAVKDFESKFAEVLGIKNCVAVGNGTDALMIALKTLGIGGEDEVLVPANSFIASSEAVTAVGAKVVFVDNHPDTYNMDVEKIEEKITGNTKVILAVHLYGQPADMDPIIEISRKYHLFVVEDTAQGHLAEYKTGSGGWEKAGTLGDVAAFSFYPGKNLGAYGDAGAIVTDNDDLARRVRMYANHGRISKYDHEFEGMNSRMDGIQGAVLGVKLNHLSAWTEKRRKAAKYYLDELKDILELDLPFVPENCNPVWHLFVVRTERRDELQRYLKNKGILTGIHYPIALPNLQAYRYLNYKPGDFPIAASYQSRLLSLPIFAEITRGQQDYIIDSIKEFFL